MPKRTNDFQSLIATIYDQVTGVNGIVTESAMVFDRDSKTLREVDILVEYRFVHHNFKLVIECRDRARRDTVEWIDALVGKVGSLAADKVVAVSKEGFTKTAKTKATAHGIEVLTVEKAVEQDWKKFPLKPGLAVLSEENYRLHDVQFRDGDVNSRNRLRNSIFVRRSKMTERRWGRLRRCLSTFFLSFCSREFRRKSRLNDWKSSKPKRTFPNFCTWKVAISFRDFQFGYPMVKKWRCQM